MARGVRRQLAMLRTRLGMEATPSPLAPPTRSPAPAPARATFDVLGPLDEGATVLEASAGTGKTWSITSLYVRLVVEHGVPVGRMLALTFGRAAAGELSARVRTRLLEVRQALEAALSSAATVSDDPVLRALVTGQRDRTIALPRGDLEARLARAVDALGSLDASGIATIHGFCLETARRRAFSLDVSFGSVLIEDDGPAIDQIVDDYLSRALANASAADALALLETARLSRDELRALAATVLGRPDATVLPAPAEWTPRSGSIEADASRFENAWKTQGEGAYIEAVAALHAQGTLKGKTFGRTKDGELFARMRERLAKLNTWLAAGVPPSDRPPPGKGLGRADLSEHLAPGRSLPAHPAIDGVDAFLERVTAAQVDGPRAGFVQFLRRELPRRRARERQLGYDDALRTLRDGLRRAGTDAAERLVGDAYDVALLDEFQDTDPVQWAIFRQLFLQAPGRRLFLVGDPKQAIYAFRGADVQVYAEACRQIPPERRGTLRDNYRSDGALVHALDTMYRDRGTAFEEDVPRYVPMRAAPGRHPWTALRGVAGARTPASLEVRWFDAATWEPGALEMAIAKGVATARIPALLADDVARALSGEVLLAPTHEAPRPLRAGDVAVLVRTNAQAAAVQRALRARGIHAVIAATGNVFHSREAGLLATFLDALADGRDVAARAFALSPLGGFSVASLHRAVSGDGPGGVAGKDAARWLALLDALADQRRLCASRGIAVALRAALERDASLLPRLAQGPDGERCLTNLRHLEELLHAREVETGRSVGALASWFAARRAADRADGDDAELRLEADRDAVRVATMHRSKGLEYPVVYLPFAWDGALLRSGDVARVFHERDADGRPTSQLVVDARRGPARPSGDRNTAWSREEALAESTRQLYVGLTRARHQVVAYMGAVTAAGGDGGLATSPIGVLLFGGRDPASPPRSRAPRAADDIAARLARGQRAAFADVVAELAALAETSRPPGAPEVPCIAWNDAPAAPERTPAPAAGCPPGTDPPVPLRAATFSRGAALASGSGYLRASYTSLTSHDVHPPATTPLVPGEDGSTEAARGSSDDLPLGRFARGPAVGIYVHGILERLDFRTARERDDRRARAPAPAAGARDLATLADEEARVHGVSAVDASLLATSLPRVLATPLGAAAGGLSLADLDPADRLDELGFDLAVGGGHAYANEPGSRVAAHTLGAIVATPRGTSADAREGLPWPPAYSAALRGGALGFPDFGGFLTGSIDLVYRVPTAQGHRYFVADYKTNWLGSMTAEGELRATAHAYRREALIAEMVKHHYFIQAHLYLLALHRYLRSRLGASYDYDVHMGGAVYLFLRGMNGPAAPPTGVVVERPPGAVIEALDAAFGGAVVGRGARS